MVDFLAIHL